MEQQADPMVLRRRLRADLQEVRLRLGLTQREVAVDLGWSLSKLLRVENGQVGVSRTDLKALLQRYDVTDPQTVEHYVRMAEQGRKQLWSSYRNVLHPEFFKYLEYEGSASRIRQFQPHVIPGLLQTEAYMRYLSEITSGDTPKDILHRQLEVREARQALLNRSDPPQLQFVLDEAVLRRCLGIATTAPELANGQLERLLEIASQPSVAVQVVPFERGPYQGSSSPFVLLEFPDPGDPDLLFRENGADSVATRGDPRKTAPFATLFERIAAIATAPEDLADFLAGMSVAGR
jgi:transcriptional regulator with XRE-family HTH domain